LIMSDFDSSTDLPPGVLGREHFEHKKKNTTKLRMGANITQTKQKANTRVN